MNTFDRSVARISARIGEPVTVTRNSWTATLSADTEQHNLWPFYAEAILVENLSGTDPLWVRTDGSSAVVNGPDEDMVLPGSFGVFVNRQPKQDGITMEPAQQFTYVSAITSGSSVQVVVSPQ